MSVTAVIPVWNGVDLLAKLLDSIDRQTARFEEIVAVDNGSSDGAAEMAERRGARVLRLGRNMGFAHAVNRGVAESRTRHIATLNSDVELDPGWLAALLDAHAPFATGKIVSADDAAVLDGTFDLLCRGGCPWRAGHGRRGEIPAQSIEMAPFTAALFEKSIFDAVGPLDERFESYLEDVDFGLRCVARGVHGRYVPAAICSHRGSAALGRWHGETVRRMARNQIFLVAKYYPRPNRLRWPVVVAHLLWGALALLHGAGWAWVRGKWQGLREWREVPHTPIPGLENRLQAQEAKIFELQRSLGMDWYWRVYFGLAGAKRHR